MGGAPPPRALSAFFGAMLAVAGADQAAKLAAVAHLSPAAHGDMDPAARRAAFHRAGALERFAWAEAAVRARHPCSDGGCPRLVVLPGRVALRYAENTGAAGLALAQIPPWWRRIVLPALSALALGATAAGLAALPGRAAVLGAIAGGALGNGLDRVRLGYVVDFIEIAGGPILNLADVALSLGIFVLLLGGRGGVALSRAGGYGGRRVAAVEDPDRFGTRPGRGRPVDQVPGGEAPHPGHRRRQGR